MSAARKLRRRVANHCFDEGPDYVEALACCALSCGDCLWILRKRVPANELFRLLYHARRTVLRGGCPHDCFDTPRVGNKETDPDNLEYVWGQLPALDHLPYLANGTEPPTPDTGD